MSLVVATVMAVGNQKTETRLSLICVTTGTALEGGRSQSYDQLGNVLAHKKVKAINHLLYADLLSQLEHTM